MVDHGLELAFAAQHAAAVQIGCARIVRRRAGPLQAALTIDPRMADPGESRGVAHHLLIDLRGLVESPGLSTQRGELTQDLPVGSGVAGGIDGLSHALDSALRVGEEPLFLGKARRRQHDIGESGRLVGKDVLLHEELDLVETTLEP